MKITHIKIDEHIGIEAEELDPKNLTKITGANGTGKSSFLEAILTCFSQKKNRVNITKTGADSSKIFIALDDGTDISWKSNGSPLVKSDGKKVNAPVSFLKKLFGGHQLNPIEFMNEDSEKQIELLLECGNIGSVHEEIKQRFGIEVNSNYNAIQQCKKAEKTLYEDRHAVNAELKALKSRVDMNTNDIPDNFNPTLYKGQDTSSMMTELTKLNKHNFDQAKLSEKREEITSEAKSLKAYIEEKKQEMQDFIAEKESKLESLRKNWLEIEILDKKPTVELEKKISEFSQYKTDLTKFKELDGLKAEVKSLTKNVKSVNDRLEKVRAMPKELIERIDLGITGLEIGDTIQVQGKPLSDLSSGEQLKMSIEIAKALSGDLKVLCIDKFETLDSKGKAEILKNAGEYQLFITEVTDDKKRKIETK